MEQGVELDALIARMIDNYVSRNRAATLLRDLLNAKITFVPAEFAPELLRRLLRERLAPRADRRQDPLTKARVVVGGVTRPHFHTHDGTAFQITHMLGLVSHVRGAVLGPAHLRLRVVRVLPILVTRLATLALLIKTPHGLGVGRVDPGLGGQ